MNLFLQSIADCSSLWAERILQASRQAVLVLGVAWILSRYLSRLPSGVRSWLWRLAFLKIAVVLAWPGRIEIPVLPSSPTSANAVVVSQDPLSTSSAAPDVEPQETLKPRVIESMPKTASLTWHFRDLVFAGWVIAVAALMGRLVWQGRAMRRFIQTLPCIEDPQWLVRLDRHCRDFGLSRRPRLVESDSAGPFLTGIMRPTIVVPSQVLSRNSIVEFDVIVRHEIAHIRRRDLIWIWLPSMIEKLLFFHPVVWLACREWWAVQEIATDEAAVRNGLLKPREYAHSLLAIVEHCANRSRRNPAVLTICDEYGRLRRRLLALGSIRCHSRRAQRALAATLLLLAVLVIPPWKLTAQETPASEQKAAPVEVDGAIATQRDLLIRAVDSDRKPLAGAKVFVNASSNAQKIVNRHYVCDVNGEVTVKVPVDLHLLRIWVSQGGHVRKFLQWWPEFQADGHLVPEEYTVELPLGTVLGGYVRDRDGAPVSGVKVEVKGAFPAELGSRDEFDTWLAEGDTARITNEEGFWSLNNMPAGEDLEVLVKLTHPDYVSDEDWGVSQRAQDVSIQSLGNKSV